MSRRGIRQKPTKPTTRPVKKFSERKRRLSAQRKRLVALGVPEKKAAALCSKEIRNLLKRPRKVAKAFAS